MATVAAAIAANRFELGAKPDELSLIASDPRGCLKSEISGEVVTPNAITALSSSQEILSRA